MSTRNWCFTVNNPNELDYPETWQTDYIAHLIYQPEIGEEGTIHLQGYLELKNPRNLTWMKNQMHATAHWERRRGTRTQAVEYCAKPESRLAQPKMWGSKNGDLPSWHFVNDQGIRPLAAELNWILLNTEAQQSSSSQKQLEEIKQKLIDGCSMDVIADEYFSTWVRYHRAFDRFVTMKTQPRNSPCEVHVIYGPTGTGKSRWAMDNYPNAYWKQRSKWWCGYAAEKEVILDEYYGWLPFDLLLRMCDRYPLLVESKGGQLQFIATTIIFTTNKCPDEWYNNAYFPALQRRVAKWHYMPSLGIHSITSSFSEFKNVINPSS